MYSEKVMDHFSNPRNVGELENPSGTGTVGNAKCGDIMKMDIQVENGIITDVKFKEALDGLPPVKMHCSMLAEQAIHAAVEDYIKKHPEEAAGLELTKAE